MQSTLRFAGFALLAFALSTAARAETVNCTVIGSLPFTIASPGIYCLNVSLGAAGDGIGIDSGDVVVDLNGHAITGSGAGIGVRSSGQKNITVRNGTVRGFRSGVSLGASANDDALVVEDLRVEDHTHLGIKADGRGAVVRRNQVVRIGGVPGTGPGGRYGIVVSGPGALVSDNQVVDTGLAAPGAVAGIRVFSEIGSVVQRNVVTNTAPAGAGLSKGIAFEAANGAAAVGNRIYGMGIGIDFSLSTGIYMDNTVGGAATPFNGGTAAGATNFSF